MIKEFILENEDTLKQIIFFMITLAVFILAAVHSIKMKKSKVQNLANLALNTDDE